MGCLIIMRSLTQAQRGVRALASAGIRAGIARPPLGLSGGSCGYALRVSCARLYDARRALSRARIAYDGVYTFEDGRWREAVL